MNRQFYKPTHRSKPHRKQEESVQLRVCQYLRANYKGIIFRSDFASGLYLSPFQASKHAKLQSGRAFPDLQVCEPTNTYKGMFLEIKREGVKVFLKNGNVRADSHLQEQAAMLAVLRNKGYYAEFAIGYDDCITKIHQYLGLPYGEQESFEF